MSKKFDYFIEIAKRHYPAMEKFANEIPVYQIDNEFYSRLRSNTFPVSDDPIVAVRLGQLSSWWFQIFNHYYRLNRTIIEALGYYEISPSFSEDEPKMLGMIRNFEYCVEHFLFRLFALMEKIAQLSNVYHKINIEEDKVNLHKINNKWTEFKLEDDFIKSVRDCYNSEVIVELIKIRHHLTHKKEIAIAGIGYPCATLIDEERNGKKILGYSYGGYKLDLDPKKMKEDIINGFNEITNMIKGVDTVLRKELMK